MVKVAGNLNVHETLLGAVNESILPGTGITPERFWSGLAHMVAVLGPKNRALLQRRAELQELIDKWMESHRGKPFDVVKMEAFLREIGYIVPENLLFQIATKKVDRRLALIAGPQLVSPVTNAQMVTNAVNAIRVSLFNALYGTDMIASDDGCEAGLEYNPNRGARVIEYVDSVLDRHFALQSGSHADVVVYTLVGTGVHKHLEAVLKGGDQTALQEPEKFVGYLGDTGDLKHIVLRHHGLHVELLVDRENHIGAQHHAGIYEVIVEAAPTTLVDFEDAVSAVDAQDKAAAYLNWLGIMLGTLSALVTKRVDGVPATKLRELSPDVTFSGPHGKEFTLPGRSLVLVRHVGLHLYTDAVTTEDGEPIPEGLLDLMVTAAAATHDLNYRGRYKNDFAGNLCIVKPKLHGSDEVAFTVESFAMAEEILGLPADTLKLFIMDEEHRTSVNLVECIRAAGARFVGTNTGFLDRTGSIIRMATKFAPMVPKEEIRKSKWLRAYEQQSVDVALLLGFLGRAVVGKGMWVKPNHMREMMEVKGAQLLAGSMSAWVPSHLAAALHMLHYLAINVWEVLSGLASRARALLSDILTPPFLDRELSPDEIQAELRNNAQGILGYVSRWVGMGIGCSKVPDINGIPLMEDLATLRISSQLLANWLYHGLINAEQIRAAFLEMAAVVDQQNIKETGYLPMGPDHDSSEAFLAALEIVLHGLEAPDGYTEAVLRRHRRAVKAAQAAKAA